MYKELTELAKKTKIDIKSAINPVLRLSNDRYYDLKLGKLLKNNINMPFYGFCEKGKNKYFVMNTGRKKQIIFSVYYPDTDIAGIHRLKINTRNPDIKGHEKRKLALIDTLWINNRKEIVYQNEKTFTSIECKKDLPKNFLGGNFPTHLYDKDKSIEKMLMLLFKQKTPIFYIDTRREDVNITTPWILREFLFSKESVKRNTKKQQLIDKLGLQINKCSFNEEIVRAEIIKKIDISINTVVFSIEKIKEGCIVVRGFIFHLQEEYPALERYRIFVNDKQVIYSRRNNKDEFIVTTKCPNHTSYTINFDHNILDKTIFNYMKDYIDYFDHTTLGNLFITSLRIPLIEQALKAGMKDYVKIALETFYNTPRNVINTLYEELDMYGWNYSPSFNKFLGLTTKQYKAIIEQFPLANYDSSTLTQLKATPIRHIKMMLSATGKNIVSLDEETFNLTLELYKLVSETLNYATYEINQLICHIDVLIIALSNSKIKFKDIIKIIKDIITFYGTDNFYNIIHIMSLYDDYIRMRHELKEKQKGWPLFPKEKIEEAHYRITDIYNKEKMKIDREGFFTNCKNCQKYEYKNEDYRVISPDTPEQIKYEGNSLNHCVSSYIPLIVQGTTNIMFIRKNNEPDIPFFTVEISNNGYIKQIHGFGNRNVDTEPGLEAFIDEWIKAYNLSTNNYNIIQ